MKATELKQLDDAKLQEKLQELNTEVFNYRFQKQLGTLEKPQVIREAKRDIARIKTILNQRGVK